MDYLLYNDFGLLKKVLNDELSDTTGDAMKCLSR